MKDTTGGENRWHSGKPSSPFLGERGQQGHLNTSSPSRTMYVEGCDDLMLPSKRLVLLLEQCTISPKPAWDGSAPALVSAGPDTEWTLAASLRCIELSRPTMVSHIRIYKNMGPTCSLMIQVCLSLAPGPVQADFIVTSQATFCGAGALATTPSFHRRHSKASNPKGQAQHTWVMYPVQNYTQLCVAYPPGLGCELR